MRASESAAECECAVYTLRAPPEGVGGLAQREEEGEQEGEGKAKDSRENLLKKRKRLKDCA